MQLDNDSHWAAILVPGWTKSGTRQMTCVIKTGFQWQSDGGLEPLSAEDCPLALNDVYVNDDAEHGSLLATDDTVPFKQGFEWLLKGTVAPEGQVTHRKLTVSFGVEGVHRKTITAIGPRQWKKSILGVVPGPPAPLESFPIQYEFAFGGRVTNDKGKVKQYDANPVGVGFAVLVNSQGVRTMPNLETEPLLRSPKDIVAPAGFGPLSLTWGGRVKKFKALDSEAALQGKCPFPNDVADDLYNSAPADQRMENLPEGELLTLEGFSKDAVSMHLPVLTDRLNLQSHQNGTAHNLKPKCDTLLIDTDQQTIALLWRVGIPWNPLSIEQPRISLSDALKHNQQPA